MQNLSLSSRISFDNNNNNKCQICAKPKLAKKLCKLANWNLNY